MVLVGLVIYLFVQGRVSHAQCSKQPSQNNPNKTNHYSHREPAGSNNHSRSERGHSECGRHGSISRGNEAIGQLAARKVGGKFCREAARQPFRFGVRETGSSATDKNPRVVVRKPHLAASDDVLFVQRTRFPLRKLLFPACNDISVRRSGTGGSNSGSNETAAGNNRADTSKYPGVAALNIELELFHYRPHEDGSQ